MSSSRLSMLLWSAVSAWGCSLAVGYTAVATEDILWRVIILVTLAASMVVTLAWLILTHLPPIAAVYQVARNAPCDCEPPRLPVRALPAFGGNVVPLRVDRLDISDN